MAYSEKVVDHYENPRNVGAFEAGDDRVDTGRVVVAIKAAVADFRSRHPEGAGTLVSEQIACVSSTH